MNTSVNILEKSASVEGGPLRLPRAKLRELMESWEAGPRYVRNRKCLIPDCGRRHGSHGFCPAHWKQYRRLGPSGLRPIRPNYIGANNPKWKGGETDDGYGRVLIYSPGHPRPSMYGTHVYRYRLVMEKHLGRLLTEKEIVHHKNGDHSDDRIENLEVMTQAEHARLHMLQRWKNQRERATL